MSSYLISRKDREIIYRADTKACWDISIATIEIALSLMVSFPLHWIFFPRQWVAPLNITIPCDSVCGLWTDYPLVKRTFLWDLPSAVRAVMYGPNTMHASGVIQQLSPSGFPDSKVLKLPARLNATANWYNIPGKPTSQNKYLMDSLTSHKHNTLNK